MSVQVGPIDFWKVRCEIDVVDLLDNRIVMHWMNPVIFMTLCCQSYIHKFVIVIPSIQPISDQKKILLCRFLTFTTG